MHVRENAATPGREYGRFTRTGSHFKTILYGLLTTDGRGMFRQYYNKFNQHAFANFLRQAVYKFKKICLIMDKTLQHRAVKIRELVEHRRPGDTLSAHGNPGPEHHRDVLEGSQAGST